MRKIIAQTMVSIDGYFEKASGEIDWHHADKEYSKYAAELLHSVEGILFGRITYELMENYWPTPAAAEHDPVIAKAMNELPKIVFTKTLNYAEWQHTTLVKDDVIEKVAQLKQQSGKDLVILGSGKLIAELTSHRLIDEYQLMISPVVLGAGNSIFQKMQDNLKLELVQSRSFSSGNVLLHYRLQQN